MEKIKAQLNKHIRGGEAFMPIDEMLKKINFEKLGIRPNGLPYSFYELFYHIYYSQRDILEYCTLADYTAPQWPEDYWPLKKAPANEEEWNHLKNAFFADRDKLSQLLSSSELNLTGRVPSGAENSFFREYLLVIEHTAYHSGQLLILLRQLGLYSS